MKTIYLDSDFKCHVSNDGTMTPIEVNMFDNKCDAFIEGYRYVPEGETWIREDGMVFYGEMITPWKNYNNLLLTQACYEMIENPNEVSPSRIDKLEAQVAYISMMTDLMEV